MLSKEVKVIAKLSSDGSLVQLVRTLACHARGRQFESDMSRQRGQRANVRQPQCQVAYKLLK